MALGTVEGAQVRYSGLWRHASVFEHMGGVSTRLNAARGGVPRSREVGKRDSERKSRHNRLGEEGD